MINFPQNPTVGDIFTSGGMSWIWDGVKWTFEAQAPTGVYLPLSGGTLTGPVNTTSTFAIPTPSEFNLGGGAADDVLTTNGSGGLSWAIASGGNITIGDNPPATPNSGDLWWNSLDGQLYVYYNDGNSSQWVVANNSGGGAFLPLVGGTLIGDLTITTSTAGAQLAIGTSTVTGWGGFELQGTAGGGNWIGGFVGGLERWEIGLGNGDAEIGGNAGSNFYLISYADDGVTGLNNPFSIERATGIVTIPSLAAPQAMGDNRVINGDMRINQRGVGSGMTLGYMADRWTFSASLTTQGNWSQTISGSAAPGFPACIGFTSNSAYTLLAADYFSFGQSIEADVVSDFQWGTANAQPVTLSFWAFSSIAGAFGGSINNYALTRSYPFTYSLPTANTWYKITVIIPGDTAGTWVMNGNAGALYVFFGMGVGATFSAPAGAWASGNYLSPPGSVSIVGTNGAQFFVTGVKLEIGSVATPFNQQSLAKSMADCQRYYQISQIAQEFYSAAGVGVIASLTHPIMRAAATAIITLNNSVNIGAVTFYDTFATSIAAASAIATVAGNTTINVTYTLDAEL
jgi:hypothetical protein